MTILTEKAFSEIVEAHTDAALTLARYILRSREDAEDAVQETFIKVYRHYHQYDATRSLKNWILAIAVNTCRDLMRKRKGTGRTDPLESERVADPSAGREQTEAALLVREVLGRLSADHRTALLLFYMEGNSVKEMAKILKVPQVVVKVRLYRARKAAQKILIEE